MRELLAALAFSPAWTEQEIVNRTEELLFRFFHRARRSVTDRQWAAFAGRGIVGRAAVSAFSAPMPCGRWDAAVWVKAAEEKERPCAC